jgi:hypothetical protein
MIEKLPRDFRLTLCVLLAVLLLLAGCSSSPPPATSSQPPTSPTFSPSPSPTATAGSPSIRITSPGSGNKFSIGSVTVVVAVDNFTLTKKIGSPPSPGEGHIIYYFDQDPPETAGQPAYSIPGSYFVSADVSYAWNNIGSGQHTFSAQLVNNDDTPLSPPVTASASLLVIPEIGPPNMVILSPRNGAELSGTSATITVQVTNFNVVDKIGQENAAREGHIIFYLDTPAPTLQGPVATTAPGTFFITTDTSYTWPGLAPGAHSFYAEIVNNNNTPLNPPISASISLTMK